MLNIYYQIPIYVLTPLKMKIKQCQQCQNVLKMTEKGRTTQIKSCGAK